MTVEEVVTLLLDFGFAPAGETRLEHVRIPTMHSPVLGGMGGERRTLGGRARYALPGSDLRVTVGPRTVNVYYARGGKVEFVLNEKTKELTAAELRAAVGTATGESRMKAEVVALFDHFADNAESYGAENLYLARRDEGYVGDPKEFRFSDIYARRIPMYKYELIVDYIDEANKSPHDRLGRRLTTAEADWMRQQAKKLYEDERAYVSGAKKKTSKQLDTEIADALSARNSPVEGLRIPADARRELLRFWRAHPALRKGCLNKYGFDPIDEEADYWRFGLAEPDHSDVLRAVRRNGGIFSLAHVKRWEIEELRDV